MIRPGAGSMNANTRNRLLTVSNSPICPFDAKYEKWVVFFFIIIFYSHVSGEPICNIDQFILI
jgi:hypothetical protein